MVPQALRLIDPNLVLSQRFTCGYGDDISDQGNDATALVNVAKVPGFSNHGFYFPGNAYITTPTNGFSTAEGTWLIWLRDWGSVNFADYLHLYLDANNLMRLERAAAGDVNFYSLAGGVYQGLVPAAGNAFVDDRRLHLVAITFSQANSRARLFFDGRLIISRFTWGSFAVPATFLIGARTTATFFCTAILDEVGVLSRELAPADISSLNGKQRTFD